MKLKLVLFGLLACFLFGKTANATESEPNNTAATANTLALNGSNSGIINPAGETDWFKVTTTGDGALTLSLTATGGKYTYFDLYDTLGVIALHTGDYTNGTTNYTVDGLAKGTYYIKVYCYYASDTGSYTISNTLSVPVQANDAEPNNTKSQALTLPQNGSRTGHVNYYYNNRRDTADWYKVTTNADGLLRLTLAPANGQYVYVSLYDNNGNTLLNTNYSNSSFSVATDGLAAGTYYLKVFCYYNTGFAPYTLSDSLFSPAQANDAEPDSTKALALPLPVNGSKTGHIGYYYNNHRDTLDWYKITTLVDGMIKLTITSANGNYTSARLYDADGITQLAYAEAVNGSASISTDGLAAGIYYVRINAYYNNQFAPYAIGDSLFTPAQANDLEPDSTKTLALPLPLNSSVTGHIGYLNNNHRDTLDWYKITTTTDGLIKLKLTSANGNYVSARLYDADGVTQLAYTEAVNSSSIVSTDGLTAGTYYVRINAYYNNQFAPYIISDSLFTYNANDAEPNKYFKQAQLLTSNSTATGHVGFYYNGVRDTVDTWKINYTGSGSLQVKLTTLPHLADGGYNYTYLQVFKDTTQAPIYNQYFIGATPLVANLTALAKGYYYVKVFEYYNSQFTAYTLSNSYTEIVPKVTVGAADTAIDCSSTNSITYKFATITGPYSVQLYRFGAAYGTVKTTSAKSLVFPGLPDGSYYATASVAGASKSGKSIAISVMAKPTGASTSSITSTSAKTNWTVLSCAKYYSVQYKDSASATWITKKTTGNVGTLLLSGLTANKTYFWKVAAVDSANKILATSANTDSLKFKTLLTGFANSESEDRISDVATQVAGRVTVYPNPASSVLHIQLANADMKTLLSLRDMNGKIVWSTQSAGAATVSADVSQLSGGIYILKIINADKTISTQKVVITK